MSEITKRFSEDARRIITAALLTAKELGHSYVGSEHILMGMLRDGGSASVGLLSDRGINYEEVRQKVVSIVGMGSKSVLSGDDMTPVCRRIILRASLIAGAEDADVVCAEHLLLSLLREDCVASRILRESNIDIDELKSAVLDMFRDNVYEPNVSDVEIVRPFENKKRIPTPLLDANATDLTEKAKNCRTDPVIGREKQEQRLISVLLRRTKNNPCLVGEAGVGKTAIVESLASRIVSDDVPDGLKNKRIMSLELSSVVAGTKYRGEFEEKIKNILDEVKRSDDVILFIDELHTVVGAGGAEGAIDASNILKPALARGEIRLIGATTLAEYKDSIEKDKALERRFQPINVPEPSEEECVKMIFGIKQRYEDFHGVCIGECAVRAAVTLSARYISERYLPDKAIDLIDEAAAELKLRYAGKKTPFLTESDIARAVETRTGIPISEINQDERERLIALENRLKSVLIGQERAVSVLCNAVRRARLGVRNGESPNGSFLFIGRSGVGKTECAKALAKAVFYNDKAFIRLDMSEFSEPHSVSKLIGSPPGYVGFNDGGSLTERVRRTPYSLVLFDEIEKAHPDVRALLLQILDEGVLTDSSGTKVGFGNTIVIMTANDVSGGAGIGFGNQEDASAAASAARVLAPELVDRIDEVIVFSPLCREELCAVAEQKLKIFCDNMRLRGINVELSEELASFAVELASSPSARAVSRTALRLAEEGVASLLLENDVRENETITLFAENKHGMAKIKQNTY